MKTNAELEVEIRTLRELVASQSKTIETLTKLVLQPQPMPAPVYVPTPCTRPHKDEIHLVPHYSGYPSYPSYPWWQVFPYQYTTCGINVGAAPQAGQFTFVDTTHAAPMHFDSINVPPVGAGAAGCAPLFDFTCVTMTGNTLAAQYAMAQS